MTLYKMKKTLTFGILAGLILSVTLAINLTMPAFAQSATVPPDEIVRAETDGKIYQYGKPIRLTIEDVNTGVKKDITAMKNVYAGIVGPCGLDYLDFVFLSGNYAKISSYDDLVAVKDNALNVVYDQPYNVYMCPIGYSKGVQKTSIEGNSREAMITFARSDGPVEMKRSLITVYEIQNIYGKESLRKQVGPNEELEYVESQTMPPGEYTIIAFTLSGEISKPLLIEVTNATNQAGSSSAPATTTGNVQPSNTMTPSNLPLLLLTIPAVFGGVMALSYKKSRNISSDFKMVTVFVMLGVSMVAVIGSNQAYAAAYNVSSQGVEHRSTGTTFKTATVEDRFEGTIVDIGQNNGLSVQNNHFIRNFVVGTDYLWSQSGVQLERPGATTYSHTCTTQSGTYTCKLPSTVNLRGVYNFWTAQFFGTCPSGFSPSLGLCVKAGAGTWTGSPLPSSTTRLDLNAYQTIQADGKVYLDQKYRTCTGSFSCGSYFTLYSHTTPTAYANSSTGHYNSQSISGTTYYGLQGAEGECGSCNSGTGRVNFYDGTYMTQTYTINSSGSPAYRATTTNNWPFEENNSICWWDSISNSGGSNPTFTTTARHTAGCQS